MIISCGMGNRSYNRLIKNKIKPFVTDVFDIEEALERFLRGELVELKDKTRSH